jgi:ABC-type multidrug transport system fused ATPase/permease subunit
MIPHLTSDGYQFGCLSCQSYLLKKFMSSLWTIFLEWENWIFQAGAFGFWILNSLWVLFIWRRDSRIRQGYLQVQQEQVQLKMTFLEGFIYFLTLVQWSTMLLLLVLTTVAQLPWTEFVFYFGLLLSWSFQFILVHLETTNSSSPRYRLLQYVIHVVLQTFYIQSQSDDPVDSLFEILINLSISIPCLLFLLEIFNPVKNAKQTNETLIDDRTPSLEDTASIFARITYTWANPLLTLGSKKPLEQEDLPHLIRKDQMETIIQEWDRFRVPGNSVVWDSVRFTKWYGIWQLSIAMITTTLDFSKPFFINLLLNWIQSKKDGESNEYGYYLLGGMFLSSLVKQILESQISLSGRHWGIQLRSIYVYEIFKKSLRRTGGASLEDEEGKTSQGKIVSLMSSDTNQVRSFLTDIHSTLIDIPLSTFISISGLLYIMGPPALGGLAVIIISGPISSWAMTRLYRILKVTRAMVDRRIQVTNEALQGIRIIKYMAWEPQFIKKICDAREDELRSRLQLLMSNALVQSLAWASSILVTFTSFFFYTIVAGKQLDAATAFTSISLLETVSYTLNDISQIVSQILNVRVTMSRINSYLGEEELEKYINGDPRNMDKNAEVAVLNGTFGYYGSGTDPVNVDEVTPLLPNQETDGFKIKDIDVHFPRNKLSVIVGATGSGKTSILLTLLGGRFG